MKTQELREAVAREDWEEAAAALQRALESAGAARAAEYPVPWIRAAARRLEIGWADATLADPTATTVTEEAAGEHAEPGFNTLVTALYDLIDARRASTAARRAACACRAVLHAVQAPLLAHWAARHPDAWEQWRQQPHVVLHPHPLSGLRSDPEVREGLREAWRRIAAQAEALDEEP